MLINLTAKINQSLSRATGASYYTNEMEVNKKNLDIRLIII